MDLSDIFRNDKPSEDVKQPDTTLNTEKNPSIDTGNNQPPEIANTEEDPLDEELERCFNEKARHPNITTSSTLSNPSIAEEQVNSRKPQNCDGDNEETRSDYNKDADKVKRVRFQLNNLFEIKEEYYEEKQKDNYSEPSSIWSREQSPSK